MGGNEQRLRENIGASWVLAVLALGVGLMMLLWLSNRRWWARVVGLEPVLVSGSEVVVVVSA